MFYTVNNKEYSSDSTPNQRILDQLINREVFCNMNQEMDFILSALAYDASIPEDPPFDESDYESAICDASSQTCSECGNSSYFDEVDVTDLDDSKFQNPDYDSDVPESEDPYICPVCGFTYPTLAQARACCESETVHVCQCCGAVYSDDEYFDSPQIVTATGVCNKNFFGFTTQDGKLYYASKIYAAYQSLIESSPVPTPPSSVSFDDLLQGGA